MVNRFVCMIALSVIIFSAQAQDARLSQIWSAPLHLNPALSGRFDGQGRFSMLSSWQSAELKQPNPTQDGPNITIPHQNISLDYKFGKYRYAGDEEAYAIGKKAAESKKNQEAKDETGDKSVNRGYWSAALNYYRYGGKETPIHASFLSATIARHSFLGSNVYYGAGLQFVYAMGDVDEKERGKLYEGEISGGGFRYPHKEIQNASNPTLYQRTKNYFDVNLGGYFGMTSEMVNFEIGLAMYHLFYPDANIIEPDDDPRSSQRHRLTANSLLRVKLLSKYGVIQRNIMWQEGMYLGSNKDNGDSAKKTEFYSGVEFVKIDPKSIYNLNFGFYTRTFKTLMPYLNFNMGRIATLRLSHELPLNSDKYNAYSAKRTEIALLLSYKRYTSPGVRFYKKSNFW